MKVKFTFSEISELEALELRGGAGVAGSNLQCTCTQIKSCISYSNCTNTHCPCTQLNECVVISYDKDQCKS